MGQGDRAWGERGREQEGEIERGGGESRRERERMILEQKR